LSHRVTSNILMKSKEIEKM